MDYIFVNAINYGKLTPIVMLIYDIVCKFIIHFRDRRMEVPEFLSIPDGLKIKQAIGLFHVHGHIKQCFARYAPTFIRGSGMLAGEIIETLWSSLNHTASSARTMSWYHRQEYLDNHMGDSNWKKLTGMGSFCLSYLALRKHWSTIDSKYSFQAVEVGWKSSKGIGEVLYRALPECRSR